MMNTKNYKLFYPKGSGATKREGWPHASSNNEIDISGVQSKSIRVGLLDLGAWLSNLHDLVYSFNKSQKAFLFYEISAPLPTGLISRPLRIIDWSKKFNWKWKKNEKEQLEDNIIANDYYKIVREINDELNLDYIVGITPSMIARWIRKKKKTVIQWNLFSAYSEKLILVSSYELRQFAKISGNSFDSFLTTIIFAQLLVAMFYPNLFFHDDNGCFFDHNKLRSNILYKVNDPVIEQECWENIPYQYHEATNAILKLIKK